MKIKYIIDEHLDIYERMVGTGWQQQFGVQVVQKKVSAWFNKIGMKNTSHHEGVDIRFHEVRNNSFKAPYEKLNDIHAHSKLEVKSIYSWYNRYKKRVPISWSQLQEADFVFLADYVGEKRAAYLFTSEEFYDCVSKIYEKRTDNNLDMILDLGRIRQYSMY